MTKIDPFNVLNDQISPQFKAKLKQFLIQAHQEGLNAVPFEGYRSFEKQQRLYQKSPSVTNASAGNSFHNYGLAVDLVFLDAKGKPSWNDSHDWNRLGQLGKEFGFVWGGDFKKIKDLGHFEFHPGLDLKSIKNLYNAGGTTLIWKKTAETKN